MVDRTQNTHALNLHYDRQYDEVSLQDSVNRLAKYMKLDLTGSRWVSLSYQHPEFPTMNWRVSIPFQLR